MKDLGLSGRGEISHIAVTDPFPLFTREGVEAMRAEIFTPEVLKTFRVSSSIAKCQIRGFNDSTPFINAAWTSPELLRAVSEAAGMELVPIMPYEIAHINVQVDGGAGALENLRPQPSPPLPGLTMSDSDSSSSSEEDETMDNVATSVHWHRDSYPWVCVVMLSDVSTMRGGETCIVKGDGTIVRTRGPQLGTAVMMQGRYIDHAALQALGASERVAMVTSFRAKDPLVPDDSVLTTIRPIANLEELYYQWSSYRLELLAARFEAKAKELHELKKRSPGWGHPIFDRAQFKEWAVGQVAYLQRTLDEMV